MGCTTKNFKKGEIFTLDSFKFVKNDVRNNLPYGDGVQVAQEWFFQHFQIAQNCFESQCGHQWLEHLRQYVNLALTKLE